MHTLLVDISETASVTDGVIVVLQYSLCIYTPTGRMLHRHVLEKQDGPLGLGLKRVAWHPSGRFIALGGFDDKIRILADVNGWRPVAEIDLPGGIFGNTAQSSTQAGRRVVRHLLDQTKVTSLLKPYSLP